MKDYLFKNTFPLCDLPCDQIANDLVAYNVISSNNIGSTMDSRQVMSQALRNIHTSLYHQQPKMFKTLLLVMERSGNAVLVDAAKNLG